MARTVHHASEAMPELPSLDPGLRLLALEGRDPAPLHSLVLDHLLVTGSTALWIDARNQGPSQLLARLAPSPRVLDRVNIARGFTAFQHAALVEHAADHLDADTGIVVAPALDSQYRDDDVRGVEPRDLLLRTVARLARYAREYEVPVLVTRTAEDRLSAPIAASAAGTIAVERTRFGPRFSSPDFETLVYPDSGTRHVQTTLAFWERVLEARQPLYEQAPAAPTSPATSEGVLHGSH